MCVGGGGVSMTAACLCKITDNVDWVCAHESLQTD